MTLTKVRIIHWLAIVIHQTNIKLINRTTKLVEPTILREQFHSKVMDADLVDSLTGPLIGKKPNTYTYTKVIWKVIIIIVLVKVFICLQELVMMTAVTSTPKPP